MCQAYPETSRAKNLGTLWMILPQLIHLWSMKFVSYMVMTTGKRPLLPQFWGFLCKFLNQWIDRNKISHEKRQALHTNSVNFLCRLQSIAAHSDHFVQRLSVRLCVCQVVTHSYVSQETHEFLGMLPLCLWISVPSNTACCGDKFVRVRGMFWRNMNRINCHPAILKILYFLCRVFIFGIFKAITFQKILQSKTS